MNVNKESESITLLDSLYITKEFECMSSVVLGMLLLACPV